MKVILQMAMTANGFIATKKDDTPWSEAEWRNYGKVVRRFGNLVVGRRTFELMSKGNDFKKIGNPVVVVVTKSKRHKSTNNSLVFVNSPKEAIRELRTRGFKRVLLGGGAKLNASFMKAGLIDEVYLDIEPVAFGGGIPLFAKSIFSSKLRLLGIKKYSKDGIQLHYKVLKQ